MNMYSQLFNVSGKVVLITGAAGHLGKSIAKTFVTLGANVILVDRNESELRILVQDLMLESECEIESFVCDLEIEEERLSLINAIQGSSPKIDVLVNNAAFVGTSDLPGWNVKFDHQSIETWRRALEVNVTAAFHLVQGLCGALRLSTSPSIINIASIYGVFAPDWRLYENTEMTNPAAYSVSKAGLIQLTTWLASLLGPEIRVNAISPGGIERNQPKEFVAKYSSRTSLGRMAEEADLVGAVVFLASPASKYITGQNIIVDGGWGN
ncbi:FabG Dehydrogenases with different specificities (related to short-chain alcohol dehydrogenases) [Candidatus Nanopelagicaceae bacterium]